jgi:hypothetical protein
MEQLLKDIKNLLISLGIEFGYHDELTEYNCG